MKHEKIIKEEGMRIRLFNMRDLGTQKGKGKMWRVLFGKM